MIIKRSLIREKAVDLNEEWPPPPPRAAVARRDWASRLVSIAMVVVPGLMLLDLAFSHELNDRSHRYPPAGPSPGTRFAALAGDYSRGGKYVGQHLSVLADGRYSYFESGCTGVHERDRGYVSLVGEYLLVASIESGKVRAYLPVEWDTRTYLVPAAGLREFIGDVARAEEPRDERGNYYVRQSSPFGVRGLPALPKEWADDLRAHLWLATIVEVKPDGRARLDVGSARGVRIGQVFRIQGYPRIHRELKVVSLAEDSCEAAEEGDRYSDEPLMVGWTAVAERPGTADPADLDPE